MEEKRPFGEKLFGKERFDERMEAVLHVKFKGKEYLLVGDLDSGGAITTQDNYDNFKVSYAHLFSDGKIRRHNEVIGARKDIEVLK